MNKDSSIAEMAAFEAWMNETPAGSSGEDPAIWVAPECHEAARISWMARALLAAQPAIPVVPSDPTEKMGPAFDVSKITKSDKFGGTTYSFKVHFLDRDLAEKAAILLCNRQLPPGPYPAQAADQADSIDLEKLELALVWHGCSTPRREMLGWFVGREVNRLIDRVLESKAEFLTRPLPAPPAASPSPQETK